ncbi:MAG: tannase/feruloyl esterase family alpha/beta hydrolase [Candidatus Dormibacteria bacterium]
MKTRRRQSLFGVLFLLAAVSAGVPGHHLQALAASPHACPGDLAAWKTMLGAEWLDCHVVADLTTTNNPWTDSGSLTGMGFPPPGSGALNSKKSNATGPAVPGLQLDGYFPDSCNAFLLAGTTGPGEPALFNKAGAPFIPGCTPANPPANATCLTQCHHDAQFVIRIPDAWNGRLMTSGTPGIRDAFASDFINSDYAMEKGWAYVSQDKGNMGANFFQDGCDERGEASPCAPADSGVTCSGSTAWCPGAATREWTFRVRQATRQARLLLNSVAPSYGVSGVNYSYVTGVSNGGYQTRRALEIDTAGDRLYDGGVDWEGTLLTPTVPAGVVKASPSTGHILFNYLPQTLANFPGDVTGDAAATAALAAVGFNPESQPLWAYHAGIYWGLTQKVYRLEFDPEYTAYSGCAPLVPIGPCVSPAAEVVPPGDPDATYDYAARLAALPALAGRIAASANTGDIQHPMITLHGDQDALLPIKTDSDLYAQMVALRGHNDIFRYYVVRGGNHVDPQFDDHNGTDAYGNTLLRPILPCVRASLDAIQAWVEKGAAAPASHTIPRDPAANASDLANKCDINVAAAAAATPAPVAQPGTRPAVAAAGGGTPNTSAGGNASGLLVAVAAVSLWILVSLRRRSRRARKVTHIRGTSREERSA